MKKSILSMAAALMLSSTMFAQLRATDQTGINVFETPKTDTKFTGPKVEFGGSIAMPYIALQQSNNITTSTINTFRNSLTDVIMPIDNPQTLFKNSPNFALSMANLNINSYLADGITLQVSLYLASKHHNETWVKGGYVQFDKVPFIKLDLLDQIMKYTTIKVGQMDVNYGDAHFRRSDGGNAIYNPFMENYIMDEFATEIGAEADVNYKGFIGVLSVTNGNLNPSLAAINNDATGSYSTGVIARKKPLVGTGSTAGITVSDSIITYQPNPLPYKYALGHLPSFIVKLGYEKQITEALHARLTGSIYYTEGAYSNTLFGGDRTGSNYSAVMYNAAPGTGTAFNGRFNPGLTDKLTAIMGNLFLKYKLMDGLSVESFSTYEVANGRSTSEATERNATQIASDLIFRFGKNENFFLGARYNTLNADVAASVATVAKFTDPANATRSGYAITQDALPAYKIGINRLAVSAGWYVTKNMLAKVEWVDQKYSNVPDKNYILNGAEFHGLSAEAVISF